MYNILCIKSGVYVYALLDLCILKTGIILIGYSLLYQNEFGVQHLVFSNVGYYASETSSNVKGKYYVTDIIYSILSKI